METVYEWIPRSTVQNTQQRWIYIALLLTVHNGRGMTDTTSNMLQNESVCY